MLALDQIASFSMF